jgi:hypothetical protein
MPNAAKKPIAAPIPCHIPNWPWPREFFEKVKSVPANKPWEAFTRDRAWLRTYLSDPSVQRELHFLTGRGCHPRPIVTLMCTMKDVDPAGTIAALKEFRKTRPAMLKKLQAVADDVSRLGSIVFVSRENRPILAAPVLLEQLRTLIAKLKRLKSFDRPKQSKKFFGIKVPFAGRRPPHKIGKTVCQTQLSEYVRKSTGKAYAARVKVLLDAAFDADHT